MLAELGGDLDTESQLSVISTKSSIGDTLSLSRSVRSGESEKFQEEEVRFRWRTQGQHILFFLAYTVNWKSLCSYTYEEESINPKYKPTLYHIIIGYVFFGGPALFLEVFVGQFTQRGCLFLGAKLPIAYGIGYCLLFSSFIAGMVHLYFTSILLHYCMVSFVNYPYPPWMICFNNYVQEFPNCFSIREIDQCPLCQTGTKGPCFDWGNVTLSAEIFRDRDAFRINPDVPNGELGPLDWKQICHIFITSLLIYFFASRKGISVGLALGLIASVITMVVFAFHKGAFSELPVMLYLNPRSLFDIKTWMATFRGIAQGINLQEGGHVLFGSFMSMSSSSEFRVWYLVASELGVILLFQVHSGMARGILACTLNMEPNQMLFNTASDIAFLMYPLTFGTLAASQLWSALYFMTMLILSLQSIVLQVIIIEESLSQEFDKSAYYAYIRFAVCLFMTLTSLLFATGRGFYAAVDIAQHEEMFMMGIMTLKFAVTFVYTIQRLSDDIHFLLRAPPSWLVKTSWCLTPAASIGCLIYYLTTVDAAEFSHVSIPLFVIASSPLLLGMLVKVYAYVKMKNLTGLLRPSEKWGPPDTETRLMRQLYNPRVEVRYRRRLEICKHFCLLNSSGVTRALERELALINKVLTEIENNEEERLARQETTAVLRRHLELMSSYIAERKPGQRAA